MATGRGLSMIYKFFNVPYLRLKRKQLEESLASTHLELAGAEKEMQSGKRVLILNLRLYSDFLFERKIFNYPGSFFFVIFVLLDLQNRSETLKLSRTKSKWKVIGSTESR